MDTSDQAIEKLVELIDSPSVVGTAFELWRREVFLATGNEGNFEDWLVRNALSVSIEAIRSDVADRQAAIQAWAKDHA